MACTPDLPVSTLNQQNETLRIFCTKSLSTSLFQQQLQESRVKSQSIKTQESINKTCRCKKIIRLSMATFSDEVHQSSSGSLVLKPKIPNILSGFETVKPPCKRFQITRHSTILLLAVQ